MKLNTQERLVQCSYGLHEWKWGNGIAYIHSDETWVIMKFNEWNEMSPRPGYIVYENMIEMILRNIDDNSYDTYINTSIQKLITQMTQNTKHCITLLFSLSDPGWQPEHRLPTSSLLSSWNQRENTTAENKYNVIKMLNNFGN